MDAAGHALYHAVDLYARATATATETATSTTSSTSTATSTSTADKSSRPGFYKIVGIVLAVCSGLFIGVSFVIKKVGLLKANVKYNEEAGEGYGYLKNAWWWLGMTLMIIGEICNFVAYAFTDAILVTPLGALAVVVTAILSAIFLKERLSFVGWVACFLCIVGSVVITLNAPQQSAVADIQEMQHYVIAPGFLSYAGVILIGCAIVAWYVGPRYGKKSMMVYLTICSLIGGLSVVATQGLGAAIVAQIGGEAQFNKWFMYVLLVFVIGTLLTEIIYLNKALNLFNAALVTPTYYVYFTASTIVASAVLFRGFHGTVTDIVDVIMGFLVICSGVVLLQLAKSSKDVPDSKVLSGELDQIRTVAEVAEPEYEPRADTIRGGAGIVRAMSQVRHMREADEAKRIHEERMKPIGEDETVEWDGLRRRKTVSTASGAGSLRRAKTLHPPLGMSSFPDPDDVSEPDSEVHPGFFGRIGRSFRSSHRRPNRGHSPVPMDLVTADKVDEEPEHVYGLPESLRKHEDTHYDDTEYRSPGPSGRAHIQWAGQESDRPDSRGSSLAPPRPPPHGTSSNKRQFSFQGVFSRNKSSASAGADDDRPTSRGALSFTSRGSHREYPTGPGTTEEERLGLVHGDSHKSLPKFDEQEEEDRESSDEWQVTSGSAGSSPEQLGASGDLGHRRSRDPYVDDDDDDLYDGPPRSPTARKDNDRWGGSGGTDSGKGGRAFV
ncbi:magnesium transporter NIPA1 [Lecanosticta acicola]|uniref:Magnesium transporter NIPA1 n=1 Tax=Lecanosticta acicola TaxID=111012 RepID=A0AAI8YV13_9PEZI|nr:magnesium transporter NIPA1 [Lecanosticta acicola]